MSTATTTAMARTAEPGIVGPRLVRPLSPSVRREPDPRLRLTRRGRLAVFLSSLAMVGAGLMTLAGAAIGSDDARQPLPTEDVTVQPGDTLWGIASDAVPGADPRDVIEQIRGLNRIGPSLQAGEKIQVPAVR